MKPTLLPLIAAVILLSGCARSAPTAAPAPTPVPAPVAGKVPLDWHLLDATANGVPGISLRRAERELLAGSQPRRMVLVAVIDNGMDTTHAALRPHLWSNPKEQPNGRDDDGNGYVDDIRGWNWLGGKDGRNVKQDTYELTRVAAMCGRPKGRDSLPERYRTRCPEIQTEFTRRRAEIDQTLQNVQQIQNILGQIAPYLRRAAHTDSLTKERVEAIQTSNDTVLRAKLIFLQMNAQGITPEDVAAAKESYESQAKYGFNPAFDPRPIVGDDYPDTLVKTYGNPNVIGPGAEHGTHVAGIIGGVRGSGVTDGALGIAQSVRLMALRVVPEGDERDKDIALAIRYAVDNGAQVINMSFGKSYSPYKELIDAAVKYADAKGVLMVHAAGNDAADTDANPSFPNPVYIGGGRARNWIEVGASSWNGKDSLVASFSNYGKTLVDVFAPGVDIYSSVSGGGYKKESGTSAASPVVAGVAALLMSYFPNLSAADVKRIILESSTKLGDQMVVRPGAGGDRVRFGDLSVTGGIVNVYNAVRMAQGLTP
jgi:subtilisin family serine protease